MKIALYGGSFDPVHAAHIEVAKTALRKQVADEVWMIPTYQNPWKTQASASYAERVAILKAAIKPYRHIKVSTIEASLAGISYTIDTLKELMKRYPQVHFCYLIGSDQAQSLVKWKDSAELVKLVSFYVFTRSEEAIDCPYPLHLIPMKIMPISSTQVRMGAFSLAAKGVKRIIAAKGLYLEQWVRSCMSEKRYRHSVSVAKLAQEIAACHHLDVHKAWMCGMLHDVCKEMPYEESKRWMMRYHPQFMHQAPAIWHGYIGAHFVETKYGVYDHDILSAIYHHVLGKGTGVYAKLLYVCDKLDPLRPYDSSAAIALCKQDLDKGFRTVKAQQLAYLKKEQVIE